MKLIDEFTFNEREYWKSVLKDESEAIINDVLSNISKLHVLNVKYYKDERGNLYKKCYLDGEKVNFNDLNAFLKNKVYEFESETRILFI